MKIKVKELIILPKKRELSIHHDHTVEDEFCFTCNESIGEEEYSKCWTADVYNQAIDVIGDMNVSVDTKIISELLIRNTYKSARQKANLIAKSLPQILKKGQDDEKSKTRND